MNSQKKDPLALPVIKQEFDDNLVTPLEGWSPLTGNIATKSSLPLSPTTSQSVSNLVSPTATTSNDSTTSNDTTTTTTSTPLPNLIKPSTDSAHKRPVIALQDQTKKLERKIRRPFNTNIKKFTPNGSIAQKNKADLAVNLELQLKQKEEQLKELTEMLTEYKNANEFIEKKYDAMKLDYSNANIKLDKLQVENGKLQEELNQLKNHHQTCITAQSSRDTLNQSQLNSVHQKNDDTKSNSAVESIDISTNARRQSNRIASKSPTGSNHTKRKLSPSKRTEKRTKKTVEEESSDDDDEVDEVAEEVNPIENKKLKKLKVLHLKCPEQNCKSKLKTMKHLHAHLSAKHDLLPVRCFAENCNSRFVNSFQLGAHFKQDHSESTKFVCPVCGQESATQNKTYVHWYDGHLGGKFQCKMDECNLVFDNRRKVVNHQLYKHCPRSKQYECPHDGCSKTFVLKRDYNRHKLLHIGRKLFICKWPKCNYDADRRTRMHKHIRKLHNVQEGDLDKYVQMDTNLVTFLK